MNLNSTDKKQIRQFGLIAFIFFGCLCFIGIWLKKPIPIYLFGLLSVLGIGFILLPAPLGSVYRGWLKIAHFMGKVVTISALTLSYYLVITPCAFIKRLFGGVPMPLMPDKDATSYWVVRTEPVQPKERYIKRY